MGHHDEEMLDDTTEGMYDTWDPKPRKWKFPSYKDYTSIDGIWQLEYTRDKLAQYGLKDPWMRNEIYKYPSWSRANPLRNIFVLLMGKNGCGIKYGFSIAAGIIICQNIYWRLRFGQRPDHMDNFTDWLWSLQEARRHPNQ